MNKMNIAIISYGRGGMLHYALDLASILERENNISLFTTEDVSEYLITDRIKIIKDVNLKKFNSAKQVLKKYPNFDIYHFTAFHPSIYSLIFTRKIRLPNVVFTIHDCNIHPYNFKLLKRLKLKLVYNKFLMNILLNKMGMNLCLSTYVAGQVNQKYGVNPLVVRLPNFSDKFKSISKVEKHYFPKINILVFGSIEKYKGIDKVIALINYVNENSIPNIHFTIAGRISKAYTGVFEKLKNTKIYDRYILDSEIDMFFSNADFLIAPYNEVSQSGVVSLALDYHVPIIASDIGSFSEYIKPENGALLIKMCPDSILNAIKEIRKIKEKSIGNIELQRTTQFKKYNNIYENIIKGINETD
ncbi:hypothetical protein AXE80_01070 [Wenyingzhuangia fucanilytica]|uniref:Glycosyl transferase family 1 domain-containing protein n=1 Tax=Wenyingzhuangia fucanilytica TaxID=1790137 RepID=A0A1B1Y2K8_9FLAO|nr:glycosyltransferase family 4 protein [Wenyingzhuangia fucanilytica]ANW94967.1 hypothetical protein AXE80_01070 [Wenyingzhuangia fucanilytica]